MDAVLGLWHRSFAGSERACEGGARRSVAVGKIISAARRRETGAAAGSELIGAFIQFGVWLPRLPRLLPRMIRAQGRDGSRRELGWAWQGTESGAGDNLCQHGGVPRDLLDPQLLCQAASTRSLCPHMSLVPPGCFHLALSPVCYQDHQGLDLHLAAA